MGISKHLMFDLEDAEDELEAALDTPDGARIAAARAAVELGVDPTFVSPHAKWQPRVGQGTAGGSGRHPSKINGLLVS